MQVDHTRAYGVFFGTSCAAPLSVELVDRDGNPPTGIRITFEGVSQIYGSGMGLFGAATPRAFFEGPGELTIGWASGRSSRVSLEAGRHYRLVESPR